ncbi:hypothetical protein ETB97_002060 [Aspergillus alliaceus]|uniref:Uncharacterized protein n=1 Tax=Petromyces alliaceus TaxID=209559 RepID=A0A8H6E5F5_PETAA|nr:hypothetical protein ETB97_002060 [Aspergillus burnettii]
MDPSAGRKQTSNDSASLHIAYQSVKILILRALLRPFNSTDHPASELEQDEEWHAARSQIRKTASTETDAALSLISNLQPAHYHAFWAPWEEYTERRETLDRARTIFRLHAKSLDIIRFALLRIDAVFWIGWEKVLGFH